MRRRPRPPPTDRVGVAFGVTFGSALHFFAFRAATLANVFFFFSGNFDGRAASSFSANSLFKYGLSAWTIPSLKHMLQFSVFWRHFSRLYKTITDEERLQPTLSARWWTWSREWPWTLSHSSLAPAPQVHSALRLPKPVLSPFSLEFEMIYWEVWISEKSWSDR